MTVDGVATGVRRDYAPELLRTSLYTFTRARCVQPAYPRCATPRGPYLEPWEGPYHGEAGGGVPASALIGGRPVNVTDVDW